MASLPHMHTEDMVYDTRVVATMEMPKMIEDQHFRETRDVVCGHIFTCQLDPSCLRVSKVGDFEVYIAVDITFNNDSIVFPVVQPHISVGYALQFLSWKSLWKAKHAACALLASRSCTAILAPWGACNWAVDESSELFVLMDMICDLFFESSTQPAPERHTLHVSFHSL